MQRLFSTFANSWPGKGLAIQRALVTAIIAHSFITNLGRTPHFLTILTQGIAAGAGLLLLIGLWTPVAGAMIAVVELCSVFLRADDPWASGIAAILAGTLAMIGPGAWSVDARLFGRKHIEISPD